MSMESSEKNLHLVYTYNRNLRYVSVIRRFQNQAPELHTVSPL